MPRPKQELDFEDQIFICQNDKKMSIAEMAAELKVTQSEIKEKLDILKANGVYEQLANLSEEDIQKKKDIVIPLHFNSMASKLLEKHNFKKQYVGFEFWKKLIALMMFNPEYLKKSLNSEIYPLIARKCNTTVANVESQLRFSLQEAMGKQKYTIVTFLSAMLNSDIEREEEAKEKKEEIKPMEEKTEAKSNMTIIDDTTLVTVPMKMIKEYYYMKGYMDAVEGNKLAEIGDVKL